MTNLCRRVAVLHLRQLFPFTTSTCKLQVKEDRHPYIKSKQTHIFFVKKKKKTNDMQIPFNTPSSSLSSFFRSVYTFTMHSSELIIKQNWNRRYVYKQNVHRIYVHLQILLIIKIKQSMSIRSYGSWLVSRSRWQAAEGRASGLQTCSASHHTRVNSLFLSTQEQQEGTQCHIL